MFFTEFDPLTTEYVETTAAAHPRAAGETCADGAGLRFTARLEGDYAPGELRYVLTDGETLQVTENGTTYTAPYTALRQGPILILTHLIPGTSRGWHLVLNTETWALTAVETWFGITVPVGIDIRGEREPEGWRDVPREIQREYYFGWADTGTNHRPDSVPTCTNRMEGRGLHWKFDTGYEILSFSPSVLCTTIVELGQEMGGITMTNPADYIRLDDRRYIFARWEVEFSGKMWLEVLDFFDMTAAGVELGFEADNSLTYRTHRAALTVTGDAAHMEKITDLGTARPVMPHLKGKGARYAYRPMDIDVPMPREEAYAHAARAQRILAGPEENFMASFNCLPPCRDLVGKTFRVVPDREKYAAAPWSGKNTDETAWEYDVFSENRLRWRRGNGPWQEEKYACFESDTHLYFLAHMETGAEDYAMVAQAMDFDNGLTTTVRTGIGNWRSEWESGADVAFGTLDAPGVTPPFTRRHCFTDELVGCCFSWTYSDVMCSIHVYSAPESLSWTIFKQDNGGGATWSSPGFYIKLRPDVYMLNWIEEKCNGSQGLVIINRKIQHDSGYFYGVTHDGLRLETTGAYMRDLGRFDIRKYF